jgi:hypothetical protein
LSDIFISYARPDRERARMFAAAFEHRGWSVWWDREIPPGRTFDDVIEEALAAARCVVVLWSNASTASSWVRNEASDAMQRKMLIPALIDTDLRIPLEFRRLQAADLSRWGGEDSVEFQQFCEAIARNVAAPRPPPVAPAPPPVAPTPTPARPDAAAPRPPAAAVAETTRAPSSARWLWIGGILVVLVIAGLASLVAEQQEAPMNGAGPAAAQVAAAAAPVFSTRLAWRDYALLYQGTLSWDGRSQTAHLSVDVADGQTKRSLGHRELPVRAFPDAPGRNVFSTQVPVDGDSTTQGPHMHNVNLVFEQQTDGNWVFVRNCMAPGNCYDASR